MQFKLFGHKITINIRKKPVVVDLSDMESACKVYGFKMMCSNPKCGCPMFEGETMCPDCGAVPRKVGK